MSADAQLLRVIFIGLAALTVPHMLLVDGLFRFQKPAGLIMLEKMQKAEARYNLATGQDNNPQGHNDV